MAVGLVVVDTDLVIDFLRGRGEGAALVRELIVDHRLRLAAVTAFELRVGTDFLDRAPSIMRLCRGRTLPLDLPTALAAAEIGARLRAAGRGIGAPDTLVAGTCLRHGLPLASRNRRHFERVDEIDLVSFDEV